MAPCHAQYLSAREIVRMGSPLDCAQEFWSGVLGIIFTILKYRWSTSGSPKTRSTTESSKSTEATKSTTLSESTTEWTQQFSHNIYNMVDKKADSTVLVNLITSTSLIFGKCLCNYILSSISDFIFQIENNIIEYNIFACFY